MTSPEGLHTVGSSEWYTPTNIVEAARSCMGSIDCDPASCAAANAHVGASCFYDLSTADALTVWSGNVFLNPPSPPRAWWDRLITRHEYRDVPQAIYIAYSIESLQQSQGWAAPMLAFPVCLPAKRVRYLTTAADLLEKASASLERARAKLVALEDADDEWSREMDPINPALKATRSAVRTLQKRVDKLSALPPDSLHPGDAPSHASAIVGVGVSIAAFTAAFSSIGAVVVPAQPALLRRKAA